MNLNEALAAYLPDVPESEDPPRIDLALEAVAKRVGNRPALSVEEHSRWLEATMMAFAAWTIEMLVQYGEGGFGWDDETADNARLGMFASLELVKQANLVEIMDGRQQGAGSNGQRKPGQGT